MKGKVVFLVKHYSVEFEIQKSVFLIKNLRDSRNFSFSRYLYYIYIYMYNIKPLLGT